MADSRNGARGHRVQYPRVKVEVTREIIDRAIRRSSKHCMIADAIRAVLPWARNVQVDMATIRFTDPVKNLRYTFLTPPIGQSRLVKFDRGRPVDPFDFTFAGLMFVTRTATRNRRPPGSDGPELAPDGRRVSRVRNAANEKERYANRAAAASLEAQKRVYARMQDPGAPLGPGVLMIPAGGNKQSAKVIVGGRPPRANPPREPDEIPGQLRTWRRYGARQFLE